MSRLRRLSFILIIFLLTAGSKLSAQNFLSDQNHINEMREDSSKVNALVNLYDTYFTNRYDSFPGGLKYIVAAYYLSVKLEYNDGIIQSAYRLGDNLLAIQNVAKSAEFYFTALKKAEELNDFVMQGKSLMGIGLVFYKQKKWKEALDYFERSIAIHKKAKPHDFMSTLLYLEGLCFSELHQYEHSKELLFEVLEIERNKFDANKAKPDSSHYYECIMGLAKVEFGLNELDSSYFKFDLCLRRYEKQDEKEALVDIHQGKAQILFAKNLVKEALQEALLAYKVAHSTNTYSLNLDEITTLLYRIYQKLGDHEKTIQYLIENRQLRDSINNEDIKEKIALANSDYTLEKNKMTFEDEINKNNKRKNIAIMSASIFGIFMLLAIFAYQTLRKERRKSEELLLNILPIETADELKRYGKAIPKYHTSATIMFLDVKEFTSIAATLTPEILVNMLDHYFRRFDEIITEHKLEKIKTIGDAYMCAGGLHDKDKHSTDHVINSIEAAIEIMKFVKETSSNMIKTYGKAFTFRIGIHTGQVVSGVVGSKKYAYDIWGDAVNVAARMEQNSQAGQINISSDTYNLVKDKYQAEYRGKISAKHKGELDMYFIQWDV